MRLLIYALNYFPEPTGAGRATGILAEGLAEAGHEVRVVTAPPYYPQWRVQPPYRSWAYRRSRHAGIEILRCPLWVPRSPAGPARVAHLASFALSSLPAVLGQVFWRPDVVMAVAPTLLTAPAALLVGRLTGAKTWLHIQDFEVDAAFDLGLLKGRRAKQTALELESRILCRFDYVSSMSQAMVQKLRSKGVTPHSAFELRLWAETEAIFPDPEAGRAMRESLAIPAGVKVVLYAGNLAEKQGIEILVGVAELLRHRRDLVFLVCGAGTGKERLLAASRSLGNFLVRDLQPPDRVNGLFNCADIHVLPQKAEAADLVFPSKLLAMLASGRCIVATAGADTEVGRILEKCGGGLCKPGDATALAATLVRFADDEMARQAVGARARHYAVENMSKERILGGLLQLLAS